MAWNRPTSNTVDATSSSRPTGRGKMPRLRTSHLIAGAAVVVLGFAALWIFSDGDTAPKAKVEKTPARIKETKPTFVPKPAVETAVVAQTVKEVKLNCVVKTNLEGHTWTESYVDANGKRHIDYHTLPVDSPFQTATDQVIGMALATPAGGPPLPSVNGMQTQFEKSLETEIVIAEDDSDKVKELKRLVIDARAAIKEMLNKGATIDDILREHRELLDADAETRRKCQRELDEIYASGDKEGAAQYETAINAALEQMGIEKVVRPLSDEEKEAQREEMRQRREERRLQKKLERIINK